MNAKQAAFLSLVAVAVICFLACLITWGTSIAFLEALTRVLAVIGFICLLIGAAIFIALFYDWLGSSS